MSEINGLWNIVSNAGTLHGIMPPPDPDDFLDEASYVRAYDQWYADVRCWKVTRREP